jgi:murein DD-endopeptidase MepM/ murein hydrolase activator NlpD
MARYLLAAGAPGDIPNAVYAYNHDWGYVANVLSYAAAYTLPASANGALLWPANGPISTYFSPSHVGIDIDQTMNVGAPVLAAHDGIVLFAGGDPCCSYGYYVILVSPTGLQTLYAHFSRITVSVGETVRQGQPLGIVGSTGLSTGTHVHFEVIRDGARVNPLDYLGN